MAVKMVVKIDPNGHHDDNSVCISRKKGKKMNRELSEDSDQPGHLPSRTKVFAVRFTGS